MEVVNPKKVRMHNSEFSWSFLPYLCFDSLRITAIGFLLVYFPPILADTFFPWYILYKNCSQISCFFSWIQHFEQESVHHFLFVIFFFLFYLFIYFFNFKKYRGSGAFKDIFWLHWGIFRLSVLIIRGQPKPDLILIIHATAFCKSNWFWAGSLTS